MGDLVEARDALLQRGGGQTTSASAFSSSANTGGGGGVVPANFEALAGDDAEVNEALRAMLMGPGHKRLPVGVTNSRKMVVVVALEARALACLGGGMGQGGKIKKLQ
jgi:hypothetical protein